MLKRWMTAEPTKKNEPAGARSGTSDQADEACVYLPADQQTHDREQDHMERAACIGEAPTRGARHCQRYV